MVDGNIRLGLVGAGKIGGYHARLAAAMQGVTFVGVHDLNRDRATDIAAEHGGTVFDSVDVLLEGSDAVVVATPTSTHFDLVKLALSADRHVLVEKPLSPRSDQAREVAELASGRGLRLQVGHVERFNAAWRALGPVKPYFIESHRLSGFSLRSLDVSVILDLMIHDIDLVQSLCGEVRPAEVRATGVPVLSGEIDIANARLEFPGGIVANLTASRISRDPMRKMRVFAHHQYYSIDFGEPSLERLTLDPERLRQDIENPKDLSQAVELPVSLDRVSLHSTNPMGEQLREFVTGIREPDRGSKDLDMAIAAIETAEEISRQINSSELFSNLARSREGRIG